MIADNFTSWWTEIEILAQIEFNVDCCVSDLIWRYLNFNDSGRKEAQGYKWHWNAGNIGKEASKYNKQQEEVHIWFKDFDFIFLLQFGKYEIIENTRKGVCITKIELLILVFTWVQSWFAYFLLESTHF